MKGTQRAREYLQDLAAIIDHLIHGRHIKFPKHICKEAFPSFANGLREQRVIRRRLFLALKKTLSEAFDLQAAGTSLRVRKVGPR
jgi:hypothetical protein